MFYRCFLVLALIFSTSAFSQTYMFDYLLEYKIESFKDSVSKKPKNYTTYRFINSQDNTYCLLVNERDKITHIQLVLETGKFFYSNLPTEDFFVEAISMRCPLTDFIPPAPVRTKDYYFSNNGDTLINTQPFHHFVFKPANEKKIKKNEISTEHFIMDNSLELQLPMFVPQSLPLKFAEEKANVPNGILKEWYSLDANGNRIAQQKLVQYLPIKKIILIDRKCK